MNEIRGQFSNVRFEDIDVDNNQQIAEEYGIRSVPTVIIERNGQEINRFTGLSSKVAYINAINESLK
jgi:thioredoxin 1